MRDANSKHFGPVSVDILLKDSVCADANTNPYSSMFTDHFGCPGRVNGRMCVGLYNNF